MLPNLPPLTLGGTAGPSSAGLSGDSGVFNASGRSINFGGTQDVKGTAQALPSIPSISPILILAVGGLVAWMLLKR